MASESSPAGPRQRGRPRLSAAELQANQALVLSAAARLFHSGHSKQLSVEMLLQEAHISRASFYRWFPNGMEQVLDQVISDTIAQLNQRMMQVIISEMNAEDRLRCCINTYFEWAVEHRQVVTGLYREAFDVQTLAYAYRKRAVTLVMELVTQQMHLLGVPPLDALSLETLILWIETASMVLFRNQQFDEASVSRQSAFTADLFLVMFQRLRSGA